MWATPPRLRLGRGTVSELNVPRAPTQGFLPRPLVTGLEGRDPGPNRLEGGLQEGAKAQHRTPPTQLLELVKVPDVLDDDASKRPSWKILFPHDALIIVAVPWCPPLLAPPSPSR